MRDLQRALPNPFARILASLMFLCGGLGAGYLGWSDLELWLQARHYVAVDATLVDVRMQTHLGRKRNNQRVHARYRYSFGEQRYESSRVGISNGSDTSSYHGDLHARLRLAYERGEPVTAWVDPVRPTDALLDRELRWGWFTSYVVFSVAFVGVACALALGLRARPADARDSG